jgi:molybdopterin molybdotransferase
MPEGADAMIMVEDTRLLPDDNVLILESAKADQHLRFQGAEVRRGDVVLPAGTRIRPADLGVLATFGYAHPLVHRLPKVAVLSTGDEVVEIDAGTPPFGKIRNSNRYALAGLVEEAGAVLHSLVHISDNLEATESAFRECVASGADVIVTAGGVSVGDRDFVKPALERLGRLEFWKIAMKPGKPLAFGNIGETLFFGLPGNPVSAMVTFELFVRPALWKMAGRRTLSRPQVLSILQDDVPHTPGRREYVRAFTTLEGGVWRSRTTGDQGSSRLRSMTGANALVMVPLESEGLKAGDQAETLLMGDAT